MIIKLKILNQYIRNYAKYAFLSNIDALYGDFGSFPIVSTKKNDHAQYWCKLITINKETLLFKTYLLKSDADKMHYKKTNWAYHIRSFLEECGL